jgi:beta-lactamase regulating signal transducer with metallopeptidase domain
MTQWLADHPEVALTLVPMLLLPVSALSAAVTLRRQLRGTRQLTTGLGSAATDARTVEVAERLGVRDRLDVVDSTVPLIFCHNILRPRICLTTRLLELLDDEELAAVLLHERHHLVRRDPARLLIARMVLAGTAYLPGASTVFHHFYASSEIAADTAALPGGRLALASAMVKLARAQSGLLTDNRALSALSTVPNRIEALLAPAPPPPSLPWSSLVKTLGALVLLVSIVSAPVAMGARPEVAAMHPCSTQARDAHGPLGSG